MLTSMSKIKEDEMTVKHKSYKFRLYPNEEQKQLFAKTFGCSRDIWNMMLADKIKHYNDTKKTLHNTPAQYKDEFPWLREVDSLALCNVQLNLQAAYKNFFQSGFGFPKFKSKKTAQSYKTNNQRGSVALENGHIKLPKIGWVKLKMHQQTKGIIKSATVSMTPTGKYHISILCETEIAPLPKTNSSVGIDLGLENFAILSTGEKISNRRFLNQLSKKLAKEQKILSRRALITKKEGRKLSDSKNYQKQRIKVAKIHEKITNQRKDFLHKLSTNLVKNHDVICIEDLSSKNLMKNRRLAKSIADVSWSEFVGQLHYKTDWYNKKLVTISRWYPSSQICSDCGVSSGKKPLSVREWTCTNCGSRHDRDINASVNILNEGLRLLS